MQRAGGALLALARAMSSARRTPGPMEATIVRKVTAALSPTHLAIANESHKHAGHAGNPGGGPDAETHFRLEVVAAAFEGQAQVARHRAVYALLAEELAAPGGVHALALKTRTPAEAAKAGGGGGGS